MTWLAVAPAAAFQFDRIAESAMGLYERHCLPHLIHFACGADEVTRRRAQVTPLAVGRVLEVGIGSGLNLAHYNRDKVECVWGLEPSEGMRRKAQARLANSPVPVRWLKGGAESIPLDDRSIDTVLLTFVLCTIPDCGAAMSEIRRVLRRGGRIVFCEHGAAPDRRVAAWQGRLNPFWRRFAGGCHLNRPVPTLLAEGGFEIEALESGYLPGGPRFASFLYWGTAVARDEGT